MGVELKKRIQEFWRREMTQLNDNIVGLDAAIMMHPRVWEASGHVENFTDPLIDCKRLQAPLPRGPDTRREHRRRTSAPTAEPTSSPRRASST